LSIVRRRGVVGRVPNSTPATRVRFPGGCSPSSRELNPHKSIFQYRVSQLKKSITIPRVTEGANGLTGISFPVLIAYSTTVVRKKIQVQP
ncbi:hypothetical protein L9F63_028099, partial [Diploptera punctata]